MTRVRIAGPRARLDEALAVVQDVGSLHVAPPRGPRSTALGDEAKAVARILGDVGARRQRLPRRSRARGPTGARST